MKSKTRRIATSLAAIGLAVLASTGPTLAAPLVLNSTRFVDADVLGFDSEDLSDTSGAITVDLATSASFGNFGALATHRSRIDAFGFFGSAAAAANTGDPLESARSLLTGSFTLATDHSFTAFLDGERGSPAELDIDNVFTYSGLLVFEANVNNGFADILADADVRLDFGNGRQQARGTLAAGSYVFVMQLRELGNGIASSRSSMDFGMAFTDLGVGGPPQAVPLPGTAALALSALGLMAGVTRRQRQAG